MASDNEASCCESDPNFAVICAFLEKFGQTCGLPTIDFLELQQMLENTLEVPQELIDLHVKLLRKGRKNVTAERWEKAVIKFCHSYCTQDAWEIERFGYRKARLGYKLRILKELLEMQFDYNSKFKSEVNKITANDLRSQPLGKDKHGHAYWFQNDNNCQIRVYKEDPDEETWTLVAKNREGLLSLISELSNGDSSGDSKGNSNGNEEDSNSLAEKPIIDTGQVETSSDSNKKSVDESDSNESKKEVDKMIISPEVDENTQMGEAAPQEGSKVQNIGELIAGKTKRSCQSDEEPEAKKSKTEVDTTEVSEIIKEPLLKVTGEGSGAENQCGNDESVIVGEAIEEEIVHVFGEGSGAECQTGNEDKVQEQKPEDSTGGVLQENIRTNTSSDSASESAIEGLKSPVKIPYKLGTIIDTKTDNSLVAHGKNMSAKKTSRWDVATIISKESCDEVSEPEEATPETPKKQMFFFGRPGCLQFKPNVSPISCSATIGFGQKASEIEEGSTSIETEDAIDIYSDNPSVIPSNAKGDIGYRILEDDKNGQYDETGGDKESDNVLKLEDTSEILTNEIPLSSATGSITDTLLEPKPLDYSTSDIKTILNTDNTKTYTVTEREVAESILTARESFIPAPKTEASDVLAAFESPNLKDNTDENVSQNYMDLDNSENVLDLSETRKTPEMEPSLTSKGEASDDLEIIENSTDSDEDSGESFSRICSVIAVPHKNNETSTDSASEKDKIDIQLPQEPSVLNIEQYSTENELVCLIKEPNPKLDEHQPSNIQLDPSEEVLEKVHLPCIPPEPANSSSSQACEDKSSDVPANVGLEESTLTVPEQNQPLQNIAMAYDNSDSDNSSNDLVIDAGYPEPDNFNEDDSELAANQIENAAAGRPIALENPVDRALNQDEDEQAEDLTIAKHSTRAHTEINANLDSPVHTLSRALSVEKETTRVEKHSEVEVLDLTEDVNKSDETDIRSPLSSKAANENTSAEPEKIPKVQDVTEEVQERKNELVRTNFVDTLDTKDVANKIAETDDKNIPESNTSDKAGDSVVPINFSNVPDIMISDSESIDELKVDGNVEAQTEEALDKKTVEGSETTIEISSNNQTEVEPVVEAVCVKKHAYICGNETSDTEKSKDEISISKPTEVQTDSPKIVDDTATIENASSVLLQSESTDKVDIDKIDSLEVVSKVDSEVLSNREEICEKDLHEHQPEKSGDTSLELDETPKSPTKAKSPESEYKESEIQKDSSEVTPEECNMKNDNTEDEKLDESEVALKERKKKGAGVCGPPRRGRSRGIPSTESEEIAVSETSKKIKLSDEPVPAIRPIPIELLKADQTEIKTHQIDDVAIAETHIVEPIIVESSSNSCDILEMPDRDPLAVSGDESTQTKPKMTLSSFSLDFTESAAPARTLRKRGHDTSQNVEEVGETPGKRQKIKGKRALNAGLRKSIEEQKKQELASSDEDNKTEQIKKKPGRPAKKREEEKDEEEAQEETGEEEKTPKKRRKKSKHPRVLINLGIDPDKPLNMDDGGMGVRQSRRIAQLKIKEEAERRKLEDEIVTDAQKKKKPKKTEDRDYKGPKKVEEPEEEDSQDSKRRKKKRKKQRPAKIFDVFNPWRSSSDSSSSAVEEEEEEIAEESDVPLHFVSVSDHEFSPESDMEGDTDALPLKRARTVKKESDVEEEVDDCPCQKCGKSDHPEWILLCDRCDNGWHCSCLRPPLLVIPEGDWFCPPCQHESLLHKLTDKLKEYDQVLNKKVNADRRKQRLAYVGISLNNVLPSKEGEIIKKRKHVTGDDDEDEDDYGNEDNDADADVGDDDAEESSSDESESGSESASATQSDSDEPIYQLRQRRQAHSYRFNDYDELINSAIQDEMEAVKGAGNQGRGKDIATIVNAEKEEQDKKDEDGEEAETVEEEQKPAEPQVEEEEEEQKQVYSDDEPQPVKKKLIGRKKHRKLNSLDISSEDEDSDEDFKGTESEDEDDFEDDLGSEDSDVLESGRNRRRYNDPVRRSTRARTSRYDADFIDDGDSDYEDEAPKKKKKRSIWDESDESEEESDISWGRRKKKSSLRPRRRRTSTTKKKSKKTKKKKNQDDDSDAEVYRKKKPKIKFGTDADSEGPVRRTRGRKINYLDALGSDSEEDRSKRPLPRIESEDEYVANEDEDVDEDDKMSDEEESGEEKKSQKIHIQSFADPNFTQPLPEGVPTPKKTNEERSEDEPNPIEQINKNLEEMDENEMEKMMEEEEYANKQLKLVGLQIEKEKKRKEMEAKKLEAAAAVANLEQTPQPKKRGRKPKNQFVFTPTTQEPIVGNVDNLLINSENNEELSEPPGVSLPMFSELSRGSNEDEFISKKRAARGNKNKKNIEENAGGLGPATPPTAPFVGQNLGAESNIEIAAPPQPFAQSQPTPSVITRMLQNKPGQPGYPVGTIRPKQFAVISEQEEEQAMSHHSMSPTSVHHGGQFMPGAVIRSQLSSPYRQMAPGMNSHFRGPPPPSGTHPIRQGLPPPPSSHPIRTGLPPPHLYHRPLDPSPSGGGAINITEHNSPGRVVSPATSSPSSIGGGKSETPPPPYNRQGPAPAPLPAAGRFPPTNTPGRHLPIPGGPHLQAARPANMSPYHPNLYHYGQFGQEDAMPPTAYQNSPYPQEFQEGQQNQAENSNSKSYDEETGGEFGGLVSYFSSQREDDLES